MYELDSFDGRKTLHFMKAFSSVIFAGHLQNCDRNYLDKGHQHQVKNEQEGNNTVRMCMPALLKSLNQSRLELGSRSTGDFEPTFQSHNFVQPAVINTANVTKVYVLL